MTQTQAREVQAFLIFKSCELMTCPQDFRKAFKKHSNTVHLTKRMNGGNCEYKAEFKREGYNITVTASEIIAVKVKFLEAAGATQTAARKFNGLPIFATVIDEVATAALSTVPTIAEHREVV